MFSRNMPTANCLITEEYMKCLGRRQSYLVGDRRSGLLRRTAIMAPGNLFDSIMIYVIDIPENYNAFFPTVKVALKSRQTITSMIALYNPALCDMRRKCRYLVALFKQAPHPSCVQLSILDSGRHHRPIVDHFPAATSHA
jgi:hypothetical protein